MDGKKVDWKSLRCMHPRAQKYPPEQVTEQTGLSGLNRD